MKNSMGSSYRFRVLTHIVYSAIITCLVEVFLITNLSMVARYIQQSGKVSALVHFILGQHLAVVILYVLLGIVIFSVTFMILEEPGIRYLGRISDAVQSISQGNLNTEVDVTGDDEFSAMAANLNKMSSDIRKLMDKEREAERTKNELITNVAHDLRTPLTSIIGYLELLAGNTQIPQEMQHKYIEIAYSKSRRLEKLIEDLFGFTKLNYGKIVPELSDIFQLVKDFDAVLGTAHISPKEAFIVVEEARNAGIKKIVLTHPEWWIVDMSLEDQIRMVKDYDIILERCYAQNMGNGRYKSNLQDNLDMVKEAGYKNVMVSTDGGQTENPHWELALAEYIQFLLDGGISRDEVYYMTHTIQRQLLGIREEE